MIWEKEAIAKVGFTTLSNKAYQFLLKCQYMNKTTIKYIFEEQIRTTRIRIFCLFCGILNQVNLARSV